MIVRLKAPIGIITQLDGTTFQFYDSPIKSGRQEFKSKGNGKEFQFYDSPIKSLPRRWPNRRTERFQFYDSPIKSSGGSRKRSPFFWFQFYDSPIKSRIWKSIKPLSWVSIL